MYRAKLELIHKWLLGPPSPDHGLARSEIKAAEKRLRVGLPEPLRDFYERLGNDPDAMSARLRFYPPEAILLERGHLRFCEEDEDGVSYAIPLGELSRLDPPVVQNTNPDKQPWQPECRQLSLFLLKSLCWQAVNALPMSATAPLTPKLMTDLETQLRPITSAEEDDGAFRPFVDKGLVVCAFPLAKVLYAAAYTDGRLQEFEKDLGLDLDRT